MEKKNLYSSEVYENCLNRIGQLTPETQPQWGTMTAAQMLAHCSEIQAVTNGKELKNTPFIVKLFRGMIRNMVLSEKPYPKSSKTHPQYKQTTDRAFDAEKKRLLAALAQFADGREKTESIEHALFGKMTTDEKGWSMYKHLDHHLTQFGV